MKTHLLLATIFLAAAAHAADSKTPNNAAAAFARPKTLVGEWEGDTQMGKARLSYELIAGGTALLECFIAEKEPAMLTVYHFDGDRLMLTHYCIAGNQPRMQLGPFNAATGELEFRFLDATNLPNPAAGYMHNAKMQIVDSNQLTNEWQFFQDGRPKFTENSKFTRIK